MEIKKLQKIETTKEKKQKKRESNQYFTIDKEEKEKDIEQKIVSTLSEEYGTEKTQEYLRMIKLIKEKKYQNLGKKREKPKII